MHLPHVPPARAIGSLQPLIERGADIELRVPELFGHQVVYRRIRTPRIGADHACASGLFSRRSGEFALQDVDAHWQRCAVVATHPRGVIVVVEVRGDLAPALHDALELGAIQRLEQTIAIVVQWCPTEREIVRKLRCFRWRILLVVIHEAAQPPPRSLTLDDLGYLFVERQNRHSMILFAVGIGGD